MIGVSYILNKLEHDYNISYSRTGFYNVGLKEGWLIKNGSRYEIDGDKFKQWVDDRINGVPDGWLSIDDIALQLGMSKSKIFKIVTSSKTIPKMRYNKLNRKKAIYADVESVKKTIEDNKIPFKW